MVRLPFPPDPVCPTCSKPIVEGIPVVLQHGELIHMRCYTEELRVRALYRVDRARSTRTLAEAARVQASRLRAPRPDRSGPGQCPLCGRAATVTDWRPSAPWVAVEDCQCRGFFVWGPLLATRVTALPPQDRRDLTKRVRAARASGREVWLATTDGTVTGPLVIATERPHRSPELGSTPEA
jgi:hypothetical protein